MTGSACRYQFPSPASCTSLYSKPPWVTEPPSNTKAPAGEAAMPPATCTSKMPLPVVAAPTLAGDGVTEMVVTPGLTLATFSVSLSVAASPALSVTSIKSLLALAV